MTHRVFLYLGSIVTQSLAKQRTDSQVVVSNLIKRKQLVEELHHFGMSTTYEEFLLFNPLTPKGPLKDYTYLNKPAAESRDR